MDAATLNALPIGAKRNFVCSRTVEVQTPQMEKPHGVVQRTTRPAPARHQPSPAPSLIADRPAHGSWIPLIVAVCCSRSHGADLPAQLGGGRSPSFTKVQSFAPGPVPVTERRPAPT